MYIGIAEYYSAELSQKIHRGLRESRAKGQYCGGKIPYGFLVRDRKVYVDEDKAAVVRYIYEQYAIGVYVPRIIQNLSEKSVFYNDKPFALNTVYKILKNERYVGIYRIGDEVYDNIYPQIVSTETFVKVRAIADRNKCGKRSVQAVYLLRHKLKCGYCGRTISAETGTSSKGAVVRYYKCLGRKHRNGCKKTAVRKEFLEDFIVDSILSVMQRPQIMDSIVKGLLAEQERQAQSSTELNLLLREKRKVETALNNLVNAIENGITSHTTNKRLHDLESRQEELDRKILIEKSKTKVKLSETEIRTYYGTALKNESQMLINLLVKEIVLYDDKVEIYFNSPIQESPDESRGFSFYTGNGVLLYKRQNKTVLQQHDMQIRMFVR